MKYERILCKHDMTATRSLPGGGGGGRRVVGQRRAGSNCCQQQITHSSFDEGFRLEGDTIRSIVTARKNEAIRLKRWYNNKYDMYHLHMSSISC